MILHDLVGCSKHWASGYFKLSNGEIVGIDQNRIARLLMSATYYMFMHSLTASHCLFTKINKFSPVPKLLI